MSFLISFVVVLLLLSGLFLYADSRKRYDLIDSVWGPGFAVIAVITLLFAEGEPTRQWVVTALTVVWGVRLGVHIHSRNRGKDEDPRYQDILRRAKETRACGCTASTCSRPCSCGSCRCLSRPHSTFRPLSEC